MKFNFSELKKTCEFRKCFSYVRRDNWKRHNSKNVSNYDDKRIVYISRKRFKKYRITVKKQKLGCLRFFSVALNTRRQHFYSLKKFFYTDCISCVMAIENDF